MNLYFPDDEKYTKNYARPHKKYQVSNILFTDDYNFEFKAV